MEELENITNTKILKLLFTKRNNSYLGVTLEVS